MIGILVILAVSWLLLHFLAKKNLLVLGFTPIPQRLFEFFIGFIVLSVLCLVAVYADTLWKQFQWQSQETFSFGLLANSLWYFLKAIVTEDLVFRGALLYLLVWKLGPKAGIALSAVAFGVYHWFSYGMFEGDIRVVPLFYIFLITGLSGVSWAYAFVKTRSIMMPMGMHLGWNQTQALFFEGQPYGELLYQVVDKVDVSEGINFIYLLARGILVPVLTIVFVQLYTKRNNEPLKISN